ncbi:hypothetical protein [Pseudomonas sp. Sample_16]|nr:hypothetical protein [Pseudomonas sp. Sample_16]
MNDSRGCSENALSIRACIRGKNRWMGKAMFTVSQETLYSGEVIDV